MREIKFRGQDFYTGEWRYGSYNGVNAGAADVFIIYEKEIFDPVSFGFIGTEIVEKEVKEETVGQFTGMTDNKNRDIYSGDIVAYRDGEFSFNAVVDYAGWEYYLDCFETNEGLGFEDFESEHELEVIGNVWEHKELLKEEE